MKPYPFTELQLAWLHRLETTTEPQTIGALHRVISDDEYKVGWCCLGLGAEVLKLRPSPWAEDAHCIAFNGSASQLMAFRELHLRGSSGELLKPLDGLDYGSTLAELNDVARWTFQQIAAYIRENPWNVFTDPAAEHAADCPHAQPRMVGACTCGFYKRDFANES